MSPIHQYFKSHPHEKRFYKHYENPTSSILVAIDMLSKRREDIWEDLGFRYGGPLVYGYTKFIKDRVKDDTVLLFTARDGYSLIRAYKLLDPDRECHYVYLQRIFNSVLFETIDLKQVNNGLKGLKHKEREDIKKLIQDNLLFFRKELGITSIPSGTTEAIDLFLKNRNSLEQLKKECKQNYTGYLAHICNSKKLEIIDATSSKFSSQRFIEKIMDNKVSGYYLVTLKKANDLNYDSYCKWPHRLVDWIRINISEFYLCSPELPICGWEHETPLFNENVPDEEKERAKHYVSISSAEIDYSRLFVSIFADKAPNLDYFTVSSWMLLCIEKKQYKKIMKKTKWASDANHLVWKPIISKDPRNIIKKHITC